MAQTISTEDIIAAIENMTLLEVSELVKALEEKFGVSAAAAVAVVAGPADGDGAAAEEEKDSFDVVLTEIGDKKIPGHQSGARDYRAGSARGQGRR